MNSVYTSNQLESFNRTQLWKICRERGLKCYPKSADCIEAISKLQESIEKKAITEVIVDKEIAPQTELETYKKDQGKTIIAEKKELQRESSYQYYQNIYRNLDNKALINAEMAINSFLANCPSDNYYYELAEPANLAIKSEKQDRSKQKKNRRSHF